MRWFRIISVSTCVITRQRGQALKHRNCSVLSILMATDLDWTLCEEKVHQLLSRTNSGEDSISDSFLKPLFKNDNTFTLCLAACSFYFSSPHPYIIKVAAEVEEKINNKSVGSNEGSKMMCFMRSNNCKRRLCGQMDRLTPQYDSI